MDRWDRFVATALVAVGCVLGVAGLILLTRHEPPPTNESSGPAIAAAVAAVGGGHATEVESTSEHGARWEVDVITPDGTAVDVRLDANFGLIEIEPEADEGEQ